MKRLFVVGLGPGGRDGMTLEAKKALEQSEVICGYTAYADLIREDYPEKEYLVSGMTKEVERCHMALLAANTDKRRLPFRRALFPHVSLRKFP